MTNFGQDKEGVPNMELNEQQLVYKNNEAPCIFLEDEYKVLQEEDYRIFDNLLNGMEELNIKNLVFRNMGYESFERISSFLSKEEEKNIVWYVKSSQVQEILKVDKIKFKKGIKIIVKISEDETEKKLIYDNICRLKEEYNNVSGVLLPILKSNYADFLTNLEAAYNQLQCSIIVAPQLNLEKAENISWNQLDTLYCNMIEFNKRVNNSMATLMEYGILPARLLNEHPCNGYVCAKHTCHSSKNDLPRRMVLLRDGTLLPESFEINKLFCIGNVNEKTLMEVIKEYKDSEPHLLFKKIAKEIYIKWIQTCPFRVVPWSRLFIDEAKGLG